MGKHRRTRDVADGVNAGDVGAPEPVGDDEPLFDFYAQRFQAEAFDVADDADGGDEALGFDRLALAVAVLDGSVDATAAALHRRNLGSGEDADAVLLERLAGEGSDLGILGGKDLRQQLDHRHLAAEGAIERGELDADGARAGNEQRARQGAGQHGLEVAPDPVPVRLQSRERPRARTGGDNDVPGGIAAWPERMLGWIGIGPRRALRRTHVDHARASQLGRAPDDVDAVLLQ